jgi:hypothetical protein
VNKLKIAFGIATVVGIAGLTVQGIETGPIITLGIGAATLISGVIAFFKKESK